MNVAIPAKNSVHHKPIKKVVGLFLIVGCATTYLMQYWNFVTENVMDNPYLDLIEYYYTKDEEYLIKTKNCQIENTHPLSKDILPYIYDMKTFNCTNKALLTYITKDKNGTVILNINMDVIEEYSLFSISCCYSTISRNQSSMDPDNEIIFSDCFEFNESVLINHNTIKVKCSNFFHTVYTNVHYVFDEPKTTGVKDDFNLLMIGIDSISRAGFMRTMPETFKYCENKEWINLKGYNKIDSNTFPNLMALLTGMEYERAFKICNPTDIEKLITCDFIWNHYKKFNYTTLYAEDLAEVATFNYMKKGFLTPPTDYYLRPYFLGINTLGYSQFHCSRPQCLGPEKTGTRMLNIINDFTSVISNRTRGFGFFWMNNFSHDDINCPKTMDEEMARFLKNLEQSGTLNDSIVVFFSDHGFRFGSIVYTHTGWVEERLPFIYIWLPQRFREKYKKEYQNLQENSVKLTTPYDLHMTLQHILSLARPGFQELQAIDCPKCRSLLKSIDSDRTCADAGIPTHWCTCTEYKKIDVEDPLVQKVAKKVEKDINNILKQTRNRCAKYFLKNVMHAKKLVIKENVEESILVGVKFFPGAVFEATVKVTYYTAKLGEPKMDPKMELVVSNRLDRYDPKSWCVRDSPIQKYCYCQSCLDRAVNIFCNNNFCLV